MIDSHERPAPKASIDGAKTPSPHTLIIALQFFADDTDAVRVIVHVEQGICELHQKARRYPFAGLYPLCHGTIHTSSARLVMHSFMHVRMYLAAHVDGVLCSCDGTTRHPAICLPLNDVQARIYYLATSRYHDKYVENICQPTRF